MKTIVKIIILSIFVQYRLSAQSIAIYRSGTYISTVDTFLQKAINLASAGDSLVLSADTFTGYRIIVDKDLIITGSQTSTDSTIIRPGIERRAVFYVQNKTSTPTKVTFKDVIIQDAVLVCSGVSVPLRIDSLYGAGIRAFENTDVTITGHSIFRHCVLNNICLSAFISDSLFFLGGAAIFSAGKLTISEDVLFTNNIAFQVLGGAISSYKELIIKDRVIFDTNQAYKGSAILARGEVNIKNQVKFLRNLAVKTGTIYIDSARMTLRDSVQIIGNTCLAYLSDSSASIGAHYSDIILKNKVIIGGNTGGRISMYSSNLYMQDSVILALNTTYENFGAGIYNKGGNVHISGGQIIGNYDLYSSTDGAGMAIYNDTIQGKPAPVLNIANARIFNPTQDFKRTIEVYNETGTNLYSDSTWWGESDTTALIFNSGSAATTLNSWIVADWSINKGIPIGKDTSFPIDAYFRLNSGAAIPPKMFWMLKGIYACDSGKFSPDTADMKTTNFISTQYTAAYTTALVTLLATVDADSFKNIQLVTGLDIKNNQSGKQDHFEIYPNPATTTITIKSEYPKEPAILKIYDMTGKLLMLKELSFKTIEEHISINYPAGSYIVDISSNGLSGQKTILIK
jgi:predicted outer membrane repeat protein